MKGTEKNLHCADLGACKFDFEDKKRTALELSYEFMEKISHHTSLVSSYLPRLKPDHVAPSAVASFSALQ